MSKRGEFGNLATLSSDPDMMPPLTEPGYDFRLRNTAQDMTTSPAMWNPDNSNRTRFGSADLSWLLTERPTLAGSLPDGAFTTDPGISLEFALSDPFDLDAGKRRPFPHFGARQAEGMRSA